MKHRFDAHNLNSIIGMMARKPHQQSEVAGGAAHSTLRPNIPKEDWEAFLEEWRQVRRQVIMDVGAYATATQTPLNEASQRTYQRIMENQQRRQLALDVSTSTPTNDGALPVGSIQDFNRLLDHLVKREGGETPSHSTDSVEEGSGSDEAAVLATTGAAASWTVESLLAASSTSSLRWNERTYSILLHRLLRQQHRAVNRAKSETAATAGATPAQGKPTESMTLWEASPKLAEAEQLFARYLEQIGPLRSPAPFLVADMMEFVKHRRAMDHRVYQLVALLLVPEARSDFVDTAAKVTAGEFSAVSLAHPQGWAGKSESHLPSAKVFEILIRHALHMQRYDECRFWYDEMRHLGIRGTGVSYHTMMELATKGNATKRPGVNANVDVGPQKDILEVYGQMKEVGLDVTNLSTTVSLINAWSNKNHFKRRMR